MSYEFISTKRHGHILQVTLNRPEVYNAMHPPMHHELAQVWDAYSVDADLWVAVLTGAGEKGRWALATASCAAFPSAVRRTR